MKTVLLKDKIEKTRKDLMSDLGIKNVMAAPRLVKVVISSGTGKAKDKKRNELVADRLTKITGQKTSMRGAKKSIATFKVREGDVIGVAVTLRGDRMYGFLDKLINVAIPRMRDFKGYDTKAIDNMGNLSVGIKEHTVFPETADEELKDVFGLAVTIVTTAKDKKTAEAFFKTIGFPFKK
jgi:large subunit ribosomal protein L5